ncbi:uncharacterized protein EV154DRAFT_566007 [Mucor mucedo]|uniref:uncharacterized protein n=1 Tax=Mucor mucedo TaxID=29922 RepID=UPI00221F9DD2|nr:uncharacterized protein EV154DRAFT_566007 [Mucor mucedo]KAI7888874.1 hypothetical protein EV154DRAFT_566007 [Mucor mucedo]
MGRTGETVIEGPSTTGTAETEETAETETAEETAATAPNEAKEGTEATTGKKRTEPTEATGATDKELDIRRAGQRQLFCRPKDEQSKRERSMEEEERHFVAYLDSVGSRKAKRKKQEGKEEHPQREDDEGNHRTGKATTGTTGAATKSVFSPAEQHTNQTTLNNNGGDSNRLQIDTARAQRTPQITSFAGAEEEEGPKETEEIPRTHTQKARLPRNRDSHVVDIHVRHTRADVPDISPETARGVGTAPVASKDWVIASQPKPKVTPEETSLMGCRMVGKLPPLTQAKPATRAKSTEYHCLSLFWHVTGAERRRKDCLVPSEVTEGKAKGERNTDEKATASGEEAAAGEQATAGEEAATGEGRTEGEATTEEDDTTEEEEDTNEFFLAWEAGVILPLQRTKSSPISTGCGLPNGGPPLLAKAQTKPKKEASFSQRKTKAKLAWNQAKTKNK